VPFILVNESLYRPVELRPSIAFEAKEQNQERRFWYGKIDGKAEIQFYNSQYPQGVADHGNN
jgi:hypothetical protein